MLWSQAFYTNSSLIPKNKLYNVTIIKNYTYDNVLKEVQKKANNVYRVNVNNTCVLSVANANFDHWEQRALSSCMLN